LQQIQKDHLKVEVDGEGREDSKVESLGSPVAANSECQSHRKDDLSRLLGLPVGRTI